MNPVSRMIRTVRKAMPVPPQACRLMRGGYLMNLEPQADPYERRIFLDRAYEPATLHLFDRVLRPGDTMVDVGANIGVMALHAALRVGPGGAVIAIEPHPRHHARLRENIALNELSNVLPIRKAMGESPCERTIFDSPNVNIGHASLIDPGDEGEAAGVVKIERLDRVLAECGVENVRLLKIDVEGFEREVLAGAPNLLARGPIICMEVEADMPTEGEDPFAAHDLIMGTGLYDSYRFAKSKFNASPLAPLADPRETASISDNVIYVPRALRETLPADLFA
jgi:FkbM family methyltransferase